MKKNILSENGFRQFLKCPRLFKYDSNFKVRKEIEILRELFERVTSMYLKNSTYNIENKLYLDLITIINRHNKKEKYLQSQYEALLNTLTIASFEMLREFPLMSYYPVYGPFILNCKIKNTVVKVNVSGVFRNKSQTINVVVFSPYSSELNVLNDPVNHFLSDNLSSLIKSHHKRPNLIFHIFYYRGKELKYIKHIFKKTNLKYDYLISQYEERIHTPLLPCNVSCKYKTKCLKENYE